MFPLTLKGLTASLDGGSVDLTDSAGDLVAVIPPAVARSGSGGPVDPDSQASSQLTYQLVTANGAPALEMSLDPAWLNAPGRVFPVIVDPTVHLDPQGSDYAQSQNGTAQTANNSGSVFLPSGTTTTSGTTYQDIDFLNYSAVGSSLSNDHITSASLNLFDAYAAQCTTAEHGDRLPGHRVVDAEGVDDLPRAGVQRRRTPSGRARRRRAACSNTSGLAGKGGWLTLPLNSAGLGLLNEWTSGTRAPTTASRCCTSLTNSHAVQAVRLLQRRQRHHLAGRRLQR